MFQSTVGMLLYLVKHKRSNIANATQELSKVNYDANPAAFCELLHVIKYVFNLKNLGLKLEPFEDANKPWDIVVLSIVIVLEILSAEEAQLVLYSMVWVYQCPGN